jgi:hypothetical protein
MVTPDDNVIRKRWWIRRKAERRLARHAVIVGFLTAACFGVAMQAGRS